VKGGQRVLISGARAPVALAIGRAFDAGGFEVHLVDSVPSLMARWSALGGARLHRVRPPKPNFRSFREDIRGLLAKLEPSLIIPTCEEVFYLSRAAEMDGFADRLFAPPTALLRRFHSKAQFAELANECGLDPPRTWRATSSDDLQCFASRSRELVFKPDFSRFGAETLIRPTAAEVSKLKACSEKAWVVQEFIPGEEVCVWSAARDGQLVAVSGYRPKWHFGGASSYFQRDDDPALIELARKLAAHTEATGQLSLDLIRMADGRLRPIECNPRSVSGVQLFAGDARLASTLVGGEPTLITPQVEACHVGPAFWSAAAGYFVKHRETGQLASDARRSHDVLSAAGGARVTIGALLDFTRFAVNGLIASRSSTQESTADIEWNGEPIG
jgi:predicted ATP-grasp superfamily ATP-dependent carboligase